MVSEEEVRDAFPFPSFRPKQEAVLERAARALFEEGYDVVILDAPTGVGKSGINVALANFPQVKNAFYTTPQTSLREQLKADETLTKHFETLAARADYKCGVTGDNCRDCRVRRDPGLSCMTQDECTYWQAKDRAMTSDTSVITFSFLIYDKLLPVATPDGKRVSFDDRDLLIIDEAHGLEGQVASLHAGVEISPFALPDHVYAGSLSSVNGDVETFDEVRKTLLVLQKTCEEFVSEHRGDESRASDVEKCENVIQQLSWMFTEVDEHDRPWVPEVATVQYNGQRRKKLTVRPVKVDRYLNNFVWSRAEKIILSSATIPYRNNPGRWAKRLGIPSDKRVLSIPVGMPFPKENRPIHTHTAIAPMSGGGDKEHWDEIMETLDRLAGRHAGERGVIHTASYARAERAWASIQDDPDQYPNLAGNTLLHRSGQSAGDKLDEWQANDYDVLFSPTMTEGVDLVDDTCRWQALVKVPYPNIGDARVSYLLDEYNDWEWYNENATTTVVQSIGRAVRSPTDYADYYVLDSKFDSLTGRMPEWVTEAIVREDPGSPTKSQNDGLAW